MTYSHWSEAMRRALYGPHGFYRGAEPRQHFRTSSQCPRFADALKMLLAEVDASLGHPDPFTVVDVGAGSGELLTRLLDYPRLRPIAVDLRERPDGVDERIVWRDSIPEHVEGVLLSCEYLDNVPCEVAEADDKGVPHYVVFNQDGDARLGDPVQGADAEWLRRWWPLRPGERGEIGRSRDEEWERLCAHVWRGVSIAIDYGHTKAQRPGVSTVTGFVDGRQVPPVPDGSRDLTAHVAIDSLGPGRRWRQRDALRELGFRASRPPLNLAHTDPTAYVSALDTASREAQLIDADGLGAHWWLVREAGGSCQLA